MDHWECNMSKNRIPAVPKEEIARQKNIIKSINAAFSANDKAKKAFVETYGCQQNVSDGEKIKGKLGFGCMRLPMKGKEVDYEETCKMIDTFLENGFNYFDTAHHYYVQGACCHNSLIYSLEGFYTDELPPRLRIIDPAAGAQIFALDLRKFTPSIEPEFIDFCGDTCYYADEHGNLYVMEIEITDESI